MLCREVAPERPGASPVAFPARAAACADPTGSPSSGAGCGEGSSGEDAGTPPLCGRSATLGLGAGERLSRGDL